MKKSTKVLFGLALLSASTALADPSPFKLRTDLNAVISNSMAIDSGSPELTLSISQTTGSNAGYTAAQSTGLLQTLTVLPQKKPSGGAGGVSATVNITVNGVQNQAITIDRDGVPGTAATITLSPTITVTPGTVIGATVSGTAATTSDTSPGVLSNHVILNISRTF